MADKITKRGIYLYIDGKQVTNNITSIEKELRAVTRQQKNMTVGSEEYVKATEKIRTLKAMLQEHNNQHKVIGTTLDSNTGKIKKSGEEVSSFSRKFGGFVDKFNRFGAFFTAATAAIVGFTLSLRKLREERNKLEDSQANLKALTGLSDDDIKWLTERSKTLSTSVTEDGLRIRQSSNEILDAFTIVGSAKPELLGNKEALAQVTEECMRLATAAKIDLKQAVDGVTLSMNQYGAGADQAARFTNVLAAGSKMGAATVADQTAAIIKSGVAASTANISIEELVGSIETLAEKGLKGEVAGTGLKNVFLKMKTGADDTNPSIVGLQTALKNLKALSDSQILERFGLENFTVAKALIDNTEKVKSYTAAVTGTNIAMEQAAINSDTAAAKLEQARNKLRLAGNELVDRLNPAFTVSTNLMTKVIKYGPIIIDFLKENLGTIIALAAAIFSYSIAVQTITLYQTTLNNITKIGTVIKIAYTAATANLNGNLSGSAKILTTYNALLTQNNIITKLATAGSYAFAGAKALLTGNIKAAVVAVRAFSTALSLSPIGLIITAVTALGAGMFYLYKRTTESGKAMKDFNARNIEMHRELNKVYENLKIAAEGTKTRTELIEEFNRKFGEYLPNLLTEKSTLEEIKKAYDKVSIAMQQKLAQQIVQEKTEEIERKSLDKKADKLKKIQDVLERGLTGDQIKKKIPQIMKSVDDLIAKGLSADEVSKKLTESFGNANKHLYAVYDGGKRGKDIMGDFYSTLTDYVEVVKKSTDKVDSVKDRFKYLLPDSSQIQEAKEEFVNLLNEVVVTPDNKIVLSVEEQIEAIEKLYREKNIKLKEALISGEILEDTYRDLSAENDLAFLLEKKKIFEQAGRDTTSIQAQYLDKYISESNRRYKEHLDYIKNLQDEKQSFMANPEREEKYDENDLGSQIASRYGNRFEEIISINEMLYDLDLISYAEYEREKTRIADEQAATRQKIQETALNAANSLVGLASSVFSMMKSRELKEIEAKYAKEIELAGRNSTKVAQLEEAKEKEIHAVKAKYADKEFALNVLSITASTAVAVMNAYSAMASIPVVGPALGVAAAAAASVAGAAQVVQAQQARIDAKSQYYTGGYTGEGAWNEEAGIVHKREFVSNRYATSNSHLRPVFDLIDYAQRNNTVANLTGDDIAAVLTTSYSRTNALSGSSSREADSSQDNYKLMYLLMQNTKTLTRLNERLDEPFETVNSITGRNGMKQAWDKYEKIYNNKSR